jgi:hypothetical protein
MKLLARVKAIVLTPRAEWAAIEKEPAGILDLLINYVAVLAAIPELANFVGESLVGGYRPIGAGLLRAIVVYLVTFAVVYVIAVVIHLLAPRFGGKRNFANAFKLSVYSHTPLWLAGIFLLVPGLSFLELLGGVFTFALLWSGLPLLMGTRGDQVLPFAAIVTACALVPAVVLAIV